MSVRSGCKSKTDCFYFNPVPSVVTFVVCFYLMSSDLSLQDTFDIRILMAKSVKHTVNFLEAKEEDLYRFVNVLLIVRLHLCIIPSVMNMSVSLPFPLPPRIEIPFKFHMMHSGLVHGLAFWFDVAFMGSM